jgi:predicted N-acetyltransferase YhbS
VFAEYPGCVLDVDGEMPELRAIATHFRRAGGRMWVADGGRVVGCVGFTPARSGGEEGVELRKLYIERALRGSGLGDRLCGLVEAEARRRGAAFVELWSDTRFLRAHRFYERRGYVRGEATRELHDLSGSVELYFRRRLSP